MTFEEIQALTKQVNQSNINELDLEFDGGHLYLSKQSAASMTQPQQSSPVAANPAITPVAAVPESSAAALPQIKAPLVGIVYLQPAPDQAQFKQVGDQVAVGDVVCVIEAMKMMTEVKSEISGVISDILVSNEEVVEYDQPLFTVTPQ
ncbi:acetyl-CoA carboxylase, biotin carboxyl carrier protein [Bombilactobacillus folatiphilus]|uniref:Biotin carboxyl carrier protein of acetyl-CoA carboxylase n=1 Tax=Bombilactobacillus folatiphilus TaxID=2923362 RepID=A0ABY4P8R9_9LACO|nr:biotin/lipoyl-containing protein [Bombilactobacillus folatiphilus]UQS82052.1 acetyl-CoA carboxylase, biotin carboxyl carrier protein [Bombilactobacillus folatiphilus]